MSESGRPETREFRKCDICLRAKVLVEMVPVKGVSRCKKCHVQKRRSEGTGEFCRPTL